MSKENIRAEKSVAADDLSEQYRIQRYMSESNYRWKQFEKLLRDVVRQRTNTRCTFREAFRYATPQDYVTAELEMPCVKSLPLDEALELVTDLVKKPVPEKFTEGGTVQLQVLTKCHIAKKACELFQGEYMGQEQSELWRWAVDKAVRLESLGVKS